MLKFTPGTPDEMQILIACGIATYLIAFPIVVFCAAVCAEGWRRSQPDQPAVARPPAPAAGHDRAGVAAAASRRGELATAV
ncbi:hypothetical protein [Urbifossiella limnaea]|uniref:Uncharacterized protein n=1 Tax=Urbifossiella limnaea TaxID=2528023 RepID=A0A517XMK1_9BACT|nr:hypothetical protein [Urbifossiella limnaea]QDU18717.1 hypothetical protein ETAA1_06100 [Urbifossiella limnaea]